MQALLSIIALLTAGAALVFALSLFFRLRSMAERQAGVLAELEQIAVAQRRVLEQFHSLTHRQRVLADKLAGTESEPGQNGGQEEASQLDHRNVKEDILFLARQGLSAETIARDLNIPCGEVELILDLERFSAKS
jgi:DNA-binding NarL/FixJ family response regulator